MGKDINLNSGEWREIVFEGRNKTYGAYRLRSSSSKRHLVAFLCTVVFTALVASIPYVTELINDLTPKKENLGGVDETRTMTNIPVEEQVQQEQIIEREIAPPPPPLKATVRFTPPVVVEDDKIDESKQMKTMVDLTQTKLQISIDDVQGTDKGIDIKHLEQHRVVVEQKVEVQKVWEHVEQMPQYPGGNAAMMQFVANNLVYPVIALETGIQGRVVVRFVVTKTGEVSDVRVIQGIDPSCNAEAVKVVQKMPKWIPGRQNGQPVPVYFTFPILFQLQ